MLLVTLLMSVMAESADKPSEQKTKTTGSVASAATKPVVIKPVIDPTSGMEFVLVKGGCFQMGDVFGDGSRYEKPAHEVCVADFNLGKHEVTQAQWQNIMGTNASTNECGPNCPVTFVSWEMAQEFIRTLNSKSGRQYRLPTEAEWEYAARSGGKKEKWAGTNDEIILSDFAWYDKNSEANLIHPVGKKKPNSLGLYDMSGNAMEWCQDWYDEGYYNVSPKDNPTGPDNGKKRVVRGGSFGSNAGLVTTTARKKDAPDALDSSNGFRLLLPVK